MANNHQTKPPKRKKTKSVSRNRDRQKGFQPDPKPADDAKDAQSSALASRQAAGNRLPEALPVILETRSNDEYALLDSGNGRKLERYGPYIINRPEAQAFWQCEDENKNWQNADAVFDSEKDEEGMGRWKFPKTPLGETWPLYWHSALGRLDYYGRFTAFRHVGVFPEQAAHWQFIEDQIVARTRQSKPTKMLNLFGYTGIASLVAARAGASVTHVDASKKSDWMGQGKPAIGQFAGQTPALDL
jgi:23S rRNA (cytosine1962-C5)-methyltransferase